MAVPRVIAPFQIPENDRDFQDFDRKPVSVRIAILNAHITCPLCAGYLINATTITECSHTFCRACIVKHFQLTNLCPQCDNKVHETQPLLKLKSDRVMQELVYKIVPGLVESEYRRESDFYRSRGIEFSRSGSHLLNIDAKKIDKDGPKQERQRPLRYDQCRHINVAHDYNFDPKIAIKVMPRTSGNVEDGTRFVLVPIRATVWHFKKLVKRVLCSDVEVDVNYDDDDDALNLYCADELLADDRTLMKQVALDYFASNEEADPSRPAVVEYSIANKE